MYFNFSLQKLVHKISRDPKYNEKSCSTVCIIYPWNVDGSVKIKKNLVKWSCSYSLSSRIF